VEAALQTPWGKKFREYGDGQVVLPGMQPRTVVQAAAGASAALSALAGLAFFLTRRKKD